MSGWFTVSKPGLRKLLEDRKKVFALYELTQNAWDEDSTFVECTLTPIDGARGKARLIVVDDNPTGFADLSHTYTLYEESRKKSAPEKRGLFNIGEKFVLALCDEAKVVSTTGAVVFERDGTRRAGRERTKTGSRFEGILSITRDEIAQVADDMRLLIPPPGKRTVYNGVVIEPRTPLTTFEATLPTVIGDSEGILRKSVRRARVEVFEVRPGEEPSIYEMGIPIVATGDRFHVNVHQKVPQNQQRDNVTPSYLRQIRTEVLNATYQLLDQSSAGEAWVSNALEDERLAPEAVTSVLHARFGKNAVIADPSDPEANYTATAAGYKVIHGGVFNRSQWENIRESEAVVPAGKLFPSARAYSDDPDAPSATVLDPSEYTDGMHDVVALTKALAQRLLRHGCVVKIVRTANSFTGCHIGRGVDNFTEFHFNVEHLTSRWFDVRTNLAAIIDLISHEFAHTQTCNHLSDEFHEAISRYAGAMVALALTEPQLFTAPRLAGNAAAR